MSNKLNKGAAFSIAKALHHAKAAAFYFGLTITESGAIRDAKQFLKDRERECERVISVTLARMTKDEMRQEIRKELDDPIWLDAMCDLLISLKPENRIKAEEWLDQLLGTQKFEKVTEGEAVAA